MLEQQYLKDNSELNEIENLSKQISDLINLGNYSQIEELDRTRLELIKNFKDKNNKNFQSLVEKLSLENTENISQIESKLISLKDEKSKFIKRFKAYNY
jgi:predicted transcriptional regulator